MRAATSVITTVALVLLVGLGAAGATTLRMTYKRISADVAQQITERNKQ
jgi:hypothetical protein